MNLSIENLQEMGAFTSTDLVEETVAWRQNGEDLSATVFIRPLSYLTVVPEAQAGREGTDPNAARIAASVCDSSGNPVFTAGDITGEADPERGPLNYGLTVALLEVISRVNGLGKRTSRSGKKKRSGTNL